jgi:5,5'-dehydrodivanillate O-demethylase oxygenase subunit
MSDANLAAKDADRFDVLTATGPGTPMGKLLRSFWQPVAIANQLAPGTARALRIMCEDLTLYRGASGKHYLIGGRCAHRCTVLHTGWVEGEQLRCMYHGWRYDGTGRCNQMPAEQRPRPELVRIAGYPIHEYGGLLFAYMGAGLAPEFDLPRKPFFEDPGWLLFPRAQAWDCNWFQQVENSLDGAHLSFAHTWGRVSRFQEEITTAIPELSYLETDAGIRQISKRSENNVRISNWTFPNNNHVNSPGPRKGDLWGHSCGWVVPIDDQHTLRMGLVAAPATDPETDRRMHDSFNMLATGFTPADYYDELFNQHVVSDEPARQLINTQDYVAVRGQGMIVDRTNETLAQTDLGIVLLRQIFRREIAAIEAGRPTKRWKRLAELPEMPTPVPETAGA